MIRIPTVLVLGAGASAHIGYPLGSKLVSDLAGLRGTAALDGLPEGWTRADAEDFLTRLSRSGHSSIDAYLESREERAPLGKYLIARELKKHEDVDRLFPPHDSGWYQYLFNQLLADDGSPDFSASSLGIITFNYDRSLEAYLHHALQARFGMSSEDAAAGLARLPIVHVHGILGAYPAIPYTPQAETNDLVRISRQIQIIHEMRDTHEGFCNPEFEQGNKMLAAAERVFFLGFGFHPDNMRRFRFFSLENVALKTVKTTCQSLRGLQVEALLKQLAEIGVGKDAIHLGTDCSSFFQYQAFLE